MVTPVDMPDLTVEDLGSPSTSVGDRFETLLRGLAGIATDPNRSWQSIRSIFGRVLRSLPIRRIGV